MSVRAELKTRKLPVCRYTGEEQAEIVIECLRRSFDSIRKVLRDNTLDEGGIIESESTTFRFEFGFNEAAYRTPAPETRGEKEA